MHACRTYTFYCCAAAGDELDGQKPGAGKARKGAVRKAKAAKRTGGVLSDFLPTDVTSVDVESEVYCRQ